MKRTPTLGLLIVAMLLLTRVNTAAASPTVEEAAKGELWSMGIGARTLDGLGNIDHTVGAHFTVTTEDGEFLGECTIAAPPNPGVPWWNCRVDVPSDRVSLIWEDPDSIPAGYAPVENPIVFDPTTYETGPHNIGAFFDNVPVNGSASTGSSKSPSSTTTFETTSTTPFTIGAMSCENSDRNCWGEIGTHFTVTTEAGEYIGECTVEELGTRGQARCNVPVPAGIVVVVTEDVTTITPGFAPESNPIRFDTAVEPIAQCASCDSGPTFENRPKAASTDSSDVTETRPLIIWASSCDDSGTCASAIGAHFTVTTEDGDFVGECTLEDLGAGPALCTVPVPVGGVVIVTEDVGTIAQGLAPESNPIRFDTGLEPFDQCAPCHWGPNFRNGPKATSTATTGSGTDTSSIAGISDSTKTWTASVQVSLCDAPPNSGREMNCHAEAGIVVNISLASGEWIGSCTVGAPQPTPWNTTISLCTVEGLPFNANFVATQDPSTIPAGYKPYNDPNTLHAGSERQGGGDQTDFAFFNIRTDAGNSTSGSAGSSSNESAEATILMTFRACPEGFDPTTGDFFADCTIPLDAPDAAIIVWGGDGHGGMSIASLDRQHNGDYVYTSGPNTMNLQLSGMAPVVRNAYQVVGADGVSGDTYTVNLTNGETREIVVFYYFE